MELAQHPEKQNRLRNELLEFNNGEDATYDQLMNEIPYLDAVLRESLRVHPPVELEQSFTVLRRRIFLVHLRNDVIKISLIVPVSLAP